ncbi:hypothetical protein Dda_2943 [Drechslerella dactyloides]|uniref:Ribonuclease n=1 Tax=Drechslerella dactyloides TaxID=74499 RepID=A0AAD6J0E9_DREDA|nr:hypothetical protein Dda_2943 [Drechslerella dactyloides]
MLRPVGVGVYNLNAQAHDATIELIHEVMAKGVNIKEIYVDTVGPPATYQAKLARIFPSCKVTVSKKADALYPSVSAASIAAKVSRDFALEQYFKLAGLVPDAGEGSVGSGYPSDPKTLTVRLCEGRFSVTDVTIGVDLDSRVVDVDDGKKIKLQIWDTAGQEASQPSLNTSDIQLRSQRKASRYTGIRKTNRPRAVQQYRSVTNSYIRNAAGALLVYDITRKETLYHVQHWLSDLKSLGEPQISIILVGNKCDLSEQRQVQATEAQAWAEENGIKFHVETSAKTGAFVEQAFVEVANEIYRNIRDGAYDLRNKGNGVRANDRLVVLFINASRYYLREGGRQSLYHPTNAPLFFSAADYPSEDREHDQEVSAIYALQKSRRNLYYSVDQDDEDDDKNYSDAGSVNDGIRSSWNPGHSAASDLTETAGGNNMVDVSLGEESLTQRRSDGINLNHDGRFDSLLETSRDTDDPSHPPIQKFRSQNSRSLAPLLNVADSSQETTYPDGRSSERQNTFYGSDAAASKSRIAENRRGPPPDPQTFPASQTKSQVDAGDETEPSVELQKSNCLILGPSGTGKTLIAKTLAKVLDVPFSISDCTAFTQAGYVGEDVDVCVQRLLASCNWDVKRAETGIICLDEVDKIASVKSSSHMRDVSASSAKDPRRHNSRNNEPAIKAKFTTGAQR